MQSRILENFLKLWNHQIFLFFQIIYRGGNDTAFTICSSPQSRPNNSGPEVRMHRNLFAGLFLFLFFIIFVLQIY
jgi:hypothetical protein